MLNRPTEREKDEECDKRTKMNGFMPRLTESYASASDEEIENMERAEDVM